MHVKRSILTLAIVGALATTACTSPTQSPTSNLGPRTQNGAAIGAIAGGLLGATRKGDGKLGKAAVGAVIGGIVGGAIGQQLDKQAGDLRQSIDNDQVKIVNTGNELIVTLPQDILFATDSADVSYALQSDLRAVADNLRQYPNSVIEVVGHTDNVGHADYNMSLSRRRAASVAAVLTSNGVPTSRVVTIGYGEDRPVASNLDAYGRQQNRRVEIIIRPIRN
ncbi:Outer membrane protein OmpA [Aliiroseovarius sediminilitoris]|uniref:Outer membrane protein OmpA n=1 Tax=Aliiroseovarius sediminilitoris TaxID=1173584 RepID=A0A1I0QMP8_9RHOB|nr:OmpA family protein [Aliiroseovarius sediminilitoris]SEW28488.1 Outer membrane protein OmpA [Aliiroseovarius sediminilitoris]